MSYRIPAVSSGILFFNSFLSFAAFYWVGLQSMATLSACATSTLPEVSLLKMVPQLQTILICFFPARVNTNMKYCIRDNLSNSN